MILAVAKHFRDDDGNDGFSTNINSIRTTDKSYDTCLYDHDDDALAT